MPVRRIREAGRPNIHWMRSRDSCAHNNQGGNSYFQLGRDKASEREDRRRNGEKVSAGGGRNGGLSGVMIDPGGFQWRQT